MAYGKVIELFLIDGSADGVVTAELSNWNGMAIKLPREDVPKCKIKEFEQAGVYFLFCQRDDKRDGVYIGESENIKVRLEQHISDYLSEKEKFYWQKAVVFTGRDLNKALIRYLENEFFTIAKKLNRYDVLTKNTYKNTVMKPSHIAVMAEFVDNVKILLNALGYKVLEPLRKDDKSIVLSSEDDKLLYIESGNAKARGKVTPDGFVVYKDSCINEKISKKSLSKGIINLREKYTLDGKVNEYVFMEDVQFSSSSAAADFILGYSVSGPKTWKYANGKTLKQAEEEVLSE